MNRGRGRGGSSMRGRRPSGAGPTTTKGRSGPGGAAAKASASSKSAITSASNSQTAVVNQALTPIVPALYPPAGKPNPLDAHRSSLVPVLLELTQYYKSNYSIPIPKGKFESPFQVARYSDRYNEPLSIDPHLLHKPDDKRLPAELLTKGIKRTFTKRPEFNMIKKLQELSNKAAAEEAEQDDFEIEEVDLVSDDEDKPTNPMIKREPKVEKEEDKPVNDDDDDEEEEMDEELDAGTDYMANYFDNGEDYLEEDEDSVDDSTY